MNKEVSKSAINNALCFIPIRLDCKHRFVGTEGYSLTLFITIAWQNQSQLNKAGWKASQPENSKMKSERVLLLPDCLRRRISAALVILPLTFQN